MSLPLPEKQLIILVANDKVWASKQNQKLGKFVSTTMNLTESQNYLKAFLLRRMRIVTNVIFQILYDEMYPHLKELRDSVDQYFLNDQCMIIQNHSLVTDPYKGQARPMDFNRTEHEEFINMVSGSTLSLTFKKLPLPEYWYSIKEYPQLSWKAKKILLYFPTTYLSKGRFSSYTSIKAYQNRLGTKVGVRIQLSCIKPDTKEIYENTKPNNYSHCISKI